MHVVTVCMLVFMTVQLCNMFSISCCLVSVVLKHATAKHDNASDAVTRHWSSGKACTKTLPQKALDAPDDSVQMHIIKPLSQCRVKYTIPCCADDITACRGTLTAEQQLGFCGAEVAQKIQPQPLKTAWP